MISRRLLLLSGFAVTLLPAAGFLVLRHIPGLALAAFSGLLWYIGVIRGKYWASHTAFVFSLAIAAFATFTGVSPLLSLVIVIFALAGWDLSRFTPRVESIFPLETALRLESLHLRRLGLTLGIGAAAGLAAILVEIQLSFRAAIAMGLTVMVLLALSARELRRHEAETPPDS